MAKEKEFVEVDGVELEYEPNSKGCKLDVDPVTLSLDNIDISREMDIIRRWEEKHRKEVKV
jgi:hypothetical protein